MDTSFLFQDCYTGRVFAKKLGVEIMGNGMVATPYSGWLGLLKIA